MNRVRDWLVRRLFKPKVGETRRWDGVDYYLVQADWTQDINAPGRLQLTYVTRLTADRNFFIEVPEKGS